MKLKLSRDVENSDHVCNVKRANACFVLEMNSLRVLAISKPLKNQPIQEQLSIMN